jgi:NDP-sugar pyrophosphorylase family protein
VIKTLLVDGDNLFKIGFHGAKELFYDGNHIGGVFHFINILRKFLEEHKPMGTIGSVGLIKKISNNFIVLNCDVISDVNLNELLKFHKTHKSILTIGVKHFQYKNPNTQCKKFIPILILN